MSKKVDEIFNDNPQSADVIEPPKKQSRIRRKAEKHQKKVKEEKNKEAAFKEYAKASKKENDYRDASDPLTTGEKIKAKWNSFLSYFKIHKSPSQKARVKVNPKYLFIILGSICVVLIILSSISETVAKPFKAVASVIVVPAQKGINNVGYWISDKIEFISDVNKVYEQNKELEKQIADLTASNVALRQKQAELNRLRKILDLKNSFVEYDTIAAEIIAKDSSDWFATFTISKGSADGIKKDMNVIAEGGLVGIVIDVGLNYSVVRSIIDDNNSVSGMFEKSGELCFVRGNITLMKDNMIEFSDVSVNVDIEVNEAIVTSHVSSKYLPGLLIGYVSDYKLDGSELTQSGHVIPAVDFTNIHEVLVITQLKEISD